MKEQKKLIIHNADGTKTEVEPSKPWSPCGHDIGERCHICDREGREERLRAALKEMKSLFEAWDLRGICIDRLEGYEQGVLLELIEMCEEIAGINATETRDNHG